MKILAIDPGTQQSAYVIYDDVNKKIVEHGKIDNDNILILLATDRANVIVIEMMKSYGMAVGDSTLQTCVWIGRFIQAWGKSWNLINRKTVVTELCGRATANDSCVRKAVIAYFSDFLAGGYASGRGEDPIGLKSKPGPLYGIKADEWSALAIAITWSDQRAREFKQSLL